MITAMDTNPVFKRRLFSKRPGMFFSLLLSVSVLALPACDDDEDKMPEEKTIVEANESLDAAKETADVNSDGTGTRREEDRVGEGGGSTCRIGWTRCN